MRVKEQRSKTQIIDADESRKAESEAEQAEAEVAEQAKAKDEQARNKEKLSWQSMKKSKKRNIGNPRRSWLYRRLKPEIEVK